MVSENGRDTEAAVNIAEKELLVESLYQKYLYIHNDTKGNPFIVAWDKIDLTHIDDLFMGDNDKEVVENWFESIMELE
jgi:hypothetical protein